MEKNKVYELVAKYNEGLADPSEIKVIEQLIESGQVDLISLRQLASFDEQLMRTEVPTPSLRLDDQFHAMLGAEQRNLKETEISFRVPSWATLFPRLGFAAILLLVGFVGGSLLQRSATSGEDVKVLTQQLGEMKEFMMLSMLEKESASDRLKAVSLTSDMDEVSDKVTKALFQTLNHDSNVNVRLAALEALTPYTKQGSVREELIRSISHQDSPLVQVTLAELMVSIQEKKSVTELQKLVDNDNTPRDVKKQIKKSIDILI